MSVHVEALDLEFQSRPNLIASYLVRGPEGPVLVESGPGSTRPTLERRLAERGLAPGDVRHLLVTHIHLDHAGAAGWWARQGTKVYVHPIGAPHLIDPERLIASATRIYGDRMGPLWGDILAAPAERVVAVEDGGVIEAAGLRFTALATPGHASHHHAYRLDDIVFTGDAAGILRPGTPWLDLPAPPPEFDLETWKESVERLRRGGFRTLYRTHFGPSGEDADGVAAELDRMVRLLDRRAAMVREMIEAGLERDEMIEGYRRRVAEEAGAAGLGERQMDNADVVNPLYMSVDGIARYWKKSGLV